MNINELEELRKHYKKCEKEYIIKALMIFPGMGLFALFCYVAGLFIDEYVIVFIIAAIVMIAFIYGFIRWVKVSHQLKDVYLKSKEKYEREARLFKSSQRYIKKAST